MALMPAAAPTDDETDDPSAGSGAGADQPASPTVLLTVMSNGDGTYTLTRGDEPEAQDADAVAPEGADMGASADAGASQGETYDSLGSLLKGIMDIVKADMESASGEGTAAQNFAAGFSGAQTVAGAKGKMGAGVRGLAQKY